MYGLCSKDVRFQTIFDFYMESTYFSYEWENFFMNDIGLCARNDVHGRKFDFYSEICAAFIEKGIYKRNAHYILSLKMTDELIEKYFNSGYDTRQLFDIMAAHLMDLDRAQIMQIEDKSHAFCSQALLVLFINGIPAGRTAPILAAPLSETEKLAHIRALSGESTYTLISRSYRNGKCRIVCAKAKQTPDEDFIDNHGNIYKNLHDLPVYTQFEY